MVCTSIRGILFGGDRYSRFPEVEVARSTKAPVVIPKVDKIFAVHGIPRIIKTDNVPPFNGEEYRRYMQKHWESNLNSQPRYGHRATPKRTFHATTR